jgi:acetyl-CoA carboxylase biotin carboxylase subunit
MDQSAPAAAVHAARATRAVPAASSLAVIPGGARLIRKVLVANRGEIACRIVRTCRAMGIRTVAVYSEADAEACHVRAADEAVHIGASPATASYLNIAALLDAARRTGSDALHPGYGFLAERAEFAAACRQAGLTFIGPSPEVIARMGSKREARRLMAAAGVPVVPGYDGDDQSDARLAAAARAIGYPVLVKASAGGGGKGMRIVAGPEELPAALAAARREAQSAFGDATLLLERLIPAPRHIEVQIIGDEHGNLVHLGERECSIQRRHQKVIEETPSPALDDALRARMAAAALVVGHTLGYTNAGTVEFVLDADGAFYFLEVNTRLQVEHPITELVTGLDLVRWQILVAEGRPLPLAQDEIRFSGHAVEARIYAEDPAAGYLPATGRVALWRPPTPWGLGGEGTGEHTSDMAGVRVDAGIETGDGISVHYDPMIAKISAHGADRTEALRRLEYALGETVLFGVSNNLDFLRRVLLHPAHLAGELDTGFLERHAGELLASAASQSGPGGLSPVGLAALVATVQRLQMTPAPATWRNNRNRPIVDRFAPQKPTLELSGDSRYSAGNVVEVRLVPAAMRAAAMGGEVREGGALGGGCSAVVVENGTETAALVSIVRRSADRTPDSAASELVIEVDGHRLRAVALEVEPNRWQVRVLGSPAGTLTLRWIAPLPEPDTRPRGADSLAAPMPGLVIAVHVREGQRVRAGEPLMTLEAMKMEHTLRAPHDGVVAALHARAGEQVAAASLLVDVRAASSEM